MSDAIQIHDLSTLSGASRQALLARTEADLGPFLDAVQPIIAAVRAEGSARRWPALPGISTRRRSRPTAWA